MADETVIEEVNEEEPVEEKEKEEDLAEMLERATISSDWKESYVDDAYVFPGYFGIRISFVDHPPRFFNGKEGSFINRKADVVMSREAFLEFAELIADVVKDLEESEEIEESEKPAME